jgi:hypothetical protein
LVVLAAVAAYFIINAVIGLIVPRLARALTVLSDKADSSEQIHQYRRLDTLLGTGAAVVRAAVICGLIYMVWKVLMPQTAPIALIGAGAFFAVLAGSTVGTLLKDVRVTSRGVRTMALDVFVTDADAGKRTIEQAIRTIPTGPTMVAKQLQISETEALGEGLWRITAVGQAMPGREWLIEDFAVKAINKYDGLREGDPVIVHGPIARHADATAERRFRRAVNARA